MQGTTSVKRPGGRSMVFATSLGFLACSVAAGAAETDPALPPDWAGALVVPVVVGAHVPANFAFAPDGGLWYAEVYTGNLSRFDLLTGTKDLRYHVNSVSAGDERGLVGFALDPAFAENGAFFLYYTEPTENASAGLNKLVRVQGGQETVLAEVPAATQHNGGRILIAADGTMFVSTGDNQLRSPAQDPKSLLGKILRMTQGGEPVAGNLDGVVFSKGHRNVYGLAYNAETAELWATENSGWRRDEVNLIRAGGNYGYPQCEGLGLNGVDTPCPTDKGYTEPLMTFYENHTAAPSGATFWRGEFYWASLKEGSIHHLWREREGGPWTDQVVFKTDGMMLDLQVAPDGNGLYFSTMDGIWRLEFPSPQGVGPPAVAGRAAILASVSSLVAVAAVSAALLLARRRT